MIASRTWRRPQALQAPTEMERLQAVPESRPAIRRQLPQSEDCPATCTASMCSVSDSTSVHQCRCRCRCRCPCASKPVSPARLQVDKRFQFVRPVGQGSYGVVSSCFDQQMGIRVAIKKIPNAFEDVQDVKRLLREVRMLRAFDHENIIGLRNLLRPHGNNTFDQL